MPQTKTIVITLISVLLIGGMGLGTFVLLSRLRPAVLNSLAQKDTSNQAAQQATGPDGDRQRAEQLLKDGKLNEAQTAYQAALAGYANAGNTAAVADIKIQLAMIQNLLKSQTTAKPQTYLPHQSGSTK